MAEPLQFAVPSTLTAQRAGQAWVLRRWDRLSDEVTLWSDEASALASLAQHARSCWDNVAGNDGVPYRPPADDRTAVDVYYGPVEDRCDEDYTLRAYDVLRHGDATHSLTLSDSGGLPPDGGTRRREPALTSTPTPGPCGSPSI